MFKFVLGPIAGMAGDLSFFESAIFTMLGMMTTVFIILILGELSRNWISNKLGFTKKFSAGTGWFKKLLNGLGIFGVAVLTPILFTPIGGAILAVTVEVSRKRIMTYMFVSASFWAVTLSFLFDRLGAAFFGL